MNNKDFYDVENKNILLTGAGKGIGESCVFNLSQNQGFVFALVKAKDNKKFSSISNIKIYNGMFEIKS